MNLIFHSQKLLFRLSAASGSAKSCAIRVLRSFPRETVEAELDILDLICSGYIDRDATRYGLCRMVPIIGNQNVKVYTDNGYKYWSGSNVYPISGIAYVGIMSAFCAEMFYRDPSSEYYYRRVELARHWAIQVRQLLSDMDKYL